MRIHPLLPLLLSSVAFPAVAGNYDAICINATDALGCIIEQAEFARQRNAEIDASMARVQLHRDRELASSLTHCKSRYSRTPRCLAERADRFAARQNNLINASMARVAEVRAFEKARNLEIAQSMAAVEARRTQELEVRQNKLIEASLAAVEVERQRRFAAHQNQLASISVERVAIQRRRQLAWQLSPCTSPIDSRPRCEAQRARDFAAHQRALATASIARVRAEKERIFAAARNAEVAASIAAVERNRASSSIETASICQINNWPIAGCITEASGVTTASVDNNAGTMSADEYASLTSHCVRAPDSPRCTAERIREFAAARNVEIERSIAAVAAARAGQEKYAAYTSHCVRAPDSPRCEAERIREFAAARNAEINASMAAVERARAERNAQHAASTSHCAQNATSPRCEAETARELQASLTHCKSEMDTSPRCSAERERQFGIARNQEIDRSMAAVAAARAKGTPSDTAVSNHTDTPAGTSPLETGAISMPLVPRIQEMIDEPRSPLRHDISSDACSVKPFDALQFTRGTAIEPNMMPELDRLATLAQNCPGVRVEVHGYADGGSPYNNRSLSQARAQAVTDYLIANGVAPNRVAAIGRGGNHAVLPYSKGYDAAFNSRAEFIVRDPGTDAAARRVMWDLAELLDPTYIPAVANLSP